MKEAEELFQALEVSSITGFLFAVYTLVQNFLMNIFPMLLFVEQECLHRSAPLAMFSSIGLLCVVLMDERIKALLQLLQKRVEKFSKLIE